MNLSIIDQAPVITQHPEDLLGCEGDPAVFSVTLQGAPQQFEFQWYRDDQEIPDATESSYTIDTLDPNDAGSYYVIVSNECGDTPSDPAVLSVELDLAIVVQPQAPASNELCAGDAWALTVTATGSNLTYQWQKDGEDIDGATTDAYVIESADFVFLMRRPGLTDGNLSSHMSKLESAGYVEVQKEFVGKKPHTMLKLTDKGRLAFDRYRATMSQVFGDLPQETKETTP